MDELADLESAAGREVVEKMEEGGAAWVWDQCGS
jgi:hypothetical protein